MKKNILSLTLLMLSIITYASVSKTLNVTSAGILSSLITTTEKMTVTNLTVTGNIDARDFKCMRDEMTVLADVDMTTVSIKAYNGASGTYFDGTFSYPANEIPNGAFSPKPMDGIPRGKKSLNTVKMPVSITSIGGIAFANCLNLTGNLVIPNSVTIIKEAAFADCTGFNGTLTLPSQLAAIEKSAFQNCSAFVGSLIMPATVTTIGDFAFMFCGGFNGTLSFGTMLTSIGTYAFSYCGNLTGQLVIPENITSIAVSSFEECSKFTELVIPQNTVSIDENSFLNCSGLTKITVGNVNPPTILSTSFDGINKTLCNVKVPNGSLLTYKNANYWKDFSIISSIGTGLYNLEAKIKIKTNHQNKEIIVEGLTNDKIVIVYDIMGKQVFQTKSSGEQVVFKADYTGVYLVKINEKVVKINL